MPLYEDDYVSIDDAGGIIIKMYYFPFGNSKRILKGNITNVEIIENPGLLTTKYWGLGLSNIWWACGMKRFGKDPSKKLIVITTGSNIRKGFICSDGPAFLQAHSGSPGTTQSQQAPLLQNENEDETDKDK
jgi:hypothetical protein